METARQRMTCTQKRAIEKSERESTTGHMGEDEGVCSVSIQTFSHSGASIRLKPKSGIYYRGPPVSLFQQCHTFPCLVFSLCLSAGKSLRVSIYYPSGGSSRGAAAASIIACAPEGVLGTLGVYEGVISYLARTHTFTPPPPPP